LVGCLVLMTSEDDSFPGVPVRPRFPLILSKGSLGAREKNVLSEVARPNGFCGDQLAKLKVIQCRLKLLLRQGA